MKTIKLITAFLLLFTLNAAGQSDTVLAAAGSSNITASEFKQRFTFAPQVYGNSELSVESKKYNLLYSIIAERLWALEAEAMGLDTSAAAQTAVNMIEKMYVRDALYNAEIKNKVTVSEEELEAEMVNLFTTLSVFFLYAPDSLTANSFYNKLESGVPVYSILSPGELELPMLEVNYGDFKPEIEQQLYSLEVNEYTTPVRSEGGWVVFYLYEKKQKSFTSEDVNSALKKAEQNIRTRKETELLKSYLNRFFRSKKVTADGNLFWAVSEQISRLLSDKKSPSNTDSTTAVFSYDDYKAAARSLGSDTLSSIIINFDPDPLTVDELLKLLLFEGFGTTMTGLKPVSYLLNKKVKLIIENELLAREGYDRGYQNLTGVKNALDIWKNNYLARIFKNEIASSVSVDDEEVYKYYMDLKSGDVESEPMISVIEFYTDSLEIIQDVLERAAQGEDFKQLAAAYTKADSSRCKYTDTGFIPAGYYGQDGSAVLNLDEGSIYGPIRKGSGYALIQLTGKKEVDRIPESGYEEVKNQLAAELKLKKTADKFIDTTVKLALKYGIEINSGALESLSVKDYKVMVFRYMGFGGKLPAVPQILPFTEWISPWKESRKETP